MKAPVSASLGAMGSLLEKLDLDPEDDLGRTRRLPKGVKNGMHILKEDLEEIGTYLHDLLEVDDPPLTAKSWMKEVRELSYDIEDYIDRFAQPGHSGTFKARSIRKISHVEISGFPKKKKKKKLKRRKGMADMISEFGIRAQEAIERHERYELGCRDLRRRFAPIGPMLPIPYEEGADLVIDGSTSEFIEKLASDGDEQLKVVSVVGSGGIGKTTLARVLYNKLRGQFDCRAFVKMNQNPDFKIVVHDMLTQLQRNQAHDDCHDLDHISKIREYLQDKRYLIIVDDLWAAPVWDIINNGFPEGSQRSRIIITTQIDDVALACCCYHSGYVFEMKPLDVDHSRKLFFNRFVCSESDCPQEFKEISYKIVEKCGGFPLATINMASLLASQPVVSMEQQVLMEQWTYICDSLSTGSSTNSASEGTRSVINLSYNNLTHYLKTCLLYLNMYPEGCTICKDDLVKQWVAEGFIGAAEGRDMEKVAESYFDELVGRRFLQPERIKYNNEVVSCTVHDMVRDLIAYKSAEENFIMVVDYYRKNVELSDKVHRLSIHFGEAEYAKTPGNIRTSQVRSLTFFGLFKCMPFISEFKLLCILNLKLSGHNGEETLDLSGISELFQLRYFKVASDVCIELPKHMQGLQNLETLDIDTKVTDVPWDITHLPCLLHLRLPFETNLMDRIGNMRPANVQSLGKLTNLQDLRLTCSTPPPDHLERNVEALGSLLGGLGNLKTLALVCDSSHRNAVVHCPSEAIVSWDGITAALLLQRFEWSPCRGSFSRVPKWIGELHNLCILKIAVRELLMDGVDVLRGLPALTALSLYVQTAPVERIVFGKAGFSVLKYFKFRCSLPRLKFEEDAMPNLRKLKLVFNAHSADQNDSTHISIEHLSCLTEISAKIGAAGADPESVLTDAVINHPSNPIINVQFVDWILCGDEDIKKVGSKPAIMTEDAMVSKDAAIGWVVQGILGSLFTEKMEEWSRKVDLDGDVENLKSAMLFVNNVVSAARGRKLQNEGLCRSLLYLKQLLYDAEDVMDELDYYRLQQEIEGGNGDGSAAGTHPMADRDTLLALESKHDVSQRINKIANQLRTAGDDVHRVLQLEISPTNAMPYQSLGEPRRNTRLTTMQVEPKVYGRDAERNKVVELLINEKYSDLHVLPIVGGGGVGKTTLARFVCDDQRIRSHFDLQMWVCVSTVFDPVRLTREMLEHVLKDGQDSGKISSFNVLQGTLLENIRNKRFLLVLDDIWEDKDKIGWVNLLAPLMRHQVPGCMILATTRSKSVAKMIGTMDVVEMKGLDEKEFWLLFEACAFGNENCTDHPTLHTIGQQIAKTLKGYPLAAQSVGALLKENLSYEHWQDVQQTWKSRQEKDGDILPILELSYDYLPPHLQHCFSYCSLFPEDYRFNGETLVSAWISQNFVQSKDTSKRLEETGMQYLYRLVDLGFFQKVGSHYVMQDLMHELAEKVSSNDCATINGSQSEIIQPSVRHLSIITTAYDEDEHCNFPSEKFENILRTIGSLKKLRTLMFFGLGSVNLLRTRSFQSLCKETESLRLLRIYVTGADIDSVHNFIKPYHLRFLEFMYAPSDNVFASGNQKDIAFPQALTRFYHLQVLGFSIWGNPTVPTRMNNLVNLRHLFVNEKVHSTIRSIGNMTSLQELRVFRVQNACGFEIKQLQSMNKLVQLGISQLGNVKTKEEASQAKLIDKEHLEMLWLSWDDSGMSRKPTTEGTRDVHVLEGLRPNQNLKYLHITGYSGATSPTWLSSNVSVTSLKTLHLEKCKGWQILPSLEMLPLLRELTLISMRNLNQKILPLEGMRCLKELRLVDMNYLKELSIPSLEKLKLIKMSRLESCISTNMAAQKEWPSSLRVLMIQDCPLLMVLPVPPSINTELSVKKVSTLPTMEHYCQGFLVSSSDVLRVLDESVLAFQNLRDITSLQIVDCPNLVSLSFGGFRQLVNLRELGIIKCGNLLYPYTMPGDIHEDSRAQANCPFLPSLTRLKIKSCGIDIAGKWLTKMLPYVQSLEELYLKDCSKIKSISIFQPRQEEESSSLASSSECLAVATTYLAQDEYLLNIPSNVLSTLKKFSIGGCPELQFCGSMEGFGAFVSLAELSIWSCPKLLSSADERFSLPSSLIKLWIKHLPTKLQPYFPDNQTSLRQLEVEESPNLEYLRLESCTALEELKICKCEQLAVLEGSQFLCSLRILKMYNVGLKSLRLESCTALEELEIHECEELAVLEGLQFLCSLRILNIKTVGLKSLRLESCTALEKLEIWDCEDLAVLEGLQYLGSLRSLHIDMNSELSAAWDRGSQEHYEGSDHARLLPPSVEEIRIYDLREEILPCFLAQLPSLSILLVSNSPNLTSLQLGSCTALEGLEIRYCKSLNSLNSLQSLRNLTYLEVESCPRVQIGGYELCHRLERVRIDDSSALTTSFCEHLTSLQRLEVSRDRVTRQLTDEQEEALQLLTSLRELVFGSCWNLVHLPAGLHNLPSLKRLEIDNCVHISRLPEKGLPPSLEQLDITRCSEMLNAHCRMLATSKLKVKIDRSTVFM